MNASTRVAITAAQMAEVGRLMIEEYGIRLIQMMENAGRLLAEQARRMLGGSARGKSVTVLCGPGHNGGGGMVAARHLDNWGTEVRAVLAGDPDRLKPVAAHQWDILRRLGLSIGAGPFETPPRLDLILDAILGYGVRGDPRAAAAEWIEWANRQGVPILALDTPSGLDTTTGTPGTPCLRATATLTLALPKTGLRAAQAQPFVGELFLADIGVPPELYHRLGIEVGPLFAESKIARIP